MACGFESRERTGKQSCQLMPSTHFMSMWKRCKSTGRCLADNRRMRASRPCRLLAHFNDTLQSESAYVEKAEGDETAAIIMYSPVIGLACSTTSFGPSNILFTSAARFSTSSSFVRASNWS